MLKRKILLIASTLLLAVSLIGCSNKNSNEVVDENDTFIVEGKEEITDPVIFSFDLEHPYNDYFTVYGQLENIDTTVTYNSTYLTKKLKASETSYIEFNSQSSFVLTIYSYENTEGSVYINDSEYKFNDGEVSVEITNQKYKIKNIGSDIYYIRLDEINNTKTIMLENGDSLSFNSDDVVEEVLSDRTRYTLSNGMIIDEYNNGKVEIVESAGSTLGTTVEEPEEVEESAEDLEIIETEAEETEVESTEENSQE